MVPFLFLNIWGKFCKWISKIYLLLPIIVHISGIIPLPTKASERLMERILEGSDSAVFSFPGDLKLCCPQSEGRLTSGQGSSRRRLTRSSHQDPIQTDVSLFLKTSGKGRFPISLSNVFQCLTTFAIGEEGSWGWLECFLYVCTY